MSDGITKKSVRTQNFFFFSIRLDIFHTNVVAFDKNDTVLPPSRGKVTLTLTSINNPVLPYTSLSYNESMSRKDNKDSKTSSEPFLYHGLGDSKKFESKYFFNINGRMTCLTWAEDKEEFDKTPAKLCQDDSTDDEMDEEVS